MLKALADAMAKDLRERGKDAVEVTGYEEENRSTGYCDSCYYEYAELVITYVDSKGKTLTADIGDSFAEYIRYLTD